MVPRTNEAGRLVDEDGKFIEQATDENILRVFDEIRGPVIVSGDVVDVLGCSRPTATRKLKELWNKGEIERRKRERSVVWWRVDDDAAEAAEALAGYDPDVVFTAMSRNLDEPITVGDTVYENGDKHPVEDMDDTTTSA